MPPTRGHDLKLETTIPKIALDDDAPHTGARLETEAAPDGAYTVEDAPHTGARLETPYSHVYTKIFPDAPHTGARLETIIPNHAYFINKRCPPHGGTT